MNYLLNGDLNQMFTQKTILKERGIQISQLDIYPSISNREDYITALKIIWDGKIEGWWNYEKEFLKYEICTKEQFIQGFQD